MTLIAQDVVDYECPQPNPDAEPPALTSADFDVLWTQSGAEVAVGEISSNGDPVEFELAVPDDAAPGSAIVIVDEATLELEVTG
ncbi:hypothetical protein [Agrococcus baldri]|uniref:hypothetical protein n=1 Tax=Agrococcus baldri TaxID=153730 RepID=UPI0011BE0757|nr:hypothetical protein [Agrococcus baldri]